MTKLPVMRWKVTRMTNVNEDAASKPPFKAFSFSFNDRAHGRMVVRMRYLDAEEAAEHGGVPCFRMKMESGPAERVTESATKTITLDRARAFAEELLDIGVFSWEESYPDDEQEGMSRWMLHMVFEPGVFEVRSSGGSAYPQGYDEMMESLYRLGLPRPESREAGTRAMRFGGLGAMSDASSPFDEEAMEGFLKSLDTSGFGGEDMMQAMRDAQLNPLRMQEVLRMQFQDLPREQQDAMLDMLASMGFASRAWWERFLRG